MPPALAKLTPTTCCRAIEEWMMKRWRLMPANATLLGDGGRMWIEFRGFVPVGALPGSAPDETIIRVLLPGNNLTDADAHLGPGFIMVRLYFSDPTPRRRTFLHGQATVEQVDTPDPAEPLLLYANRERVQAADVMVAPEDFGGVVRWPFDD